MRHLSARRFPDQITRTRSLTGAYNEYGEYVEGAVRFTVLRCSVQPIELDDDDIAGGSQLTDRLRIYLPSGEEAEVISFGRSDNFRWGKDVFRWDADIFRWREGSTRGQVGDTGAVLRAAFEDSTADRIEYGGVSYVISESRSWPARRNIPSHTRAVALRQT